MDKTKYKELQGDTDVIKLYNAWQNNNPRVINWNRFVPEEFIDKVKQNWWCGDKGSQKKYKYLVPSKIDTTKVTYNDYRDDYGKKWWIVVDKNFNKGIPQKKEQCNKNELKEEIIYPRQIEMTNLLEKNYNFKRSNNPFIKDQFYYFVTPDNLSVKKLKCISPNVNYCTFLDENGNKSDISYKKTAWFRKGSLSTLFGLNSASKYKGGKTRRRRRNGKHSKTRRISSKKY